MNQWGTTFIHLAELGQGAGRQFLGKCYLKSFQIAVPEFYKQIHHLVKAEEEPQVLLEKMRALNLHDFKEHPTTPGQKGQLWFVLSRTNEWSMSLEQVLKAYREFVSDTLQVTLYHQLKLVNAHGRTPMLMKTQGIILWSQMKSYLL